MFTRRAVRTFGLFIVLAALLGFFTVYEKSAKTSAQYKLVKLLQEEIAEAALDDLDARDKARDLNAALADADFGPPVTPRAA